MDYLVKLPKKEDLHDCKNFRGISLLSVPSKILNRVILERLREAVDTRLRDNQAGFRKGRPYADQITTLRIIIEQSLEWKSPLYINLMGFEKAFDSVDHQVLWRLMKLYGIPDKFINLLKFQDESMTFQVVHN